nr:hypothetical protein GCM10020185_77360 [Pseudomonas brassicacearum subsp. brassicacearum]
MPKAWKNVQNLSTLRGAEFIQDYGVAIADGPLKGLTARAVVVLDEKRHRAAQRAGQGNR